MQEEDAIALCRDAIRAGIFNDLGSGGNVDLCVITKSGQRMLKGYERQNEGSELRARYPRPASRVIPRGATTVISRVFTPAVRAVEVDAPESKMDVE